MARYGARYISDEYDPEPPDRPSPAELALDEEEWNQRAQGSVPEFDSEPTKRAVYRNRRGTSGRGGTAEEYNPSAHRATWKRFEE